MRKTLRVLRKARNTRKTKGGTATHLPAPYFNTSLKQSDAPAGKDLLHSIGDVIRPRIGGAIKHILRRKGGFIPSIMEGFSKMSGLYILPLATITGYKLLNHTHKQSKRMKKHYTRKQ